MASMSQTAAARAFYPDYMENPPVPAVEPGWDVGPERRIDDGRSLARALGWFSIGLGVAELVAPDRITAFIGVDHERATLIRFFGLREIASGIGILANHSGPEPWIWSRVAGDAVDLASLGAAMASEESRRGNIALAMTAVAGALALDLACARQLRSRSGGAA